MPEENQELTPDPDATLQLAQVAGKTFFGGRFQLIEPIGRGAFGVVWKAHDSSLNNAVALKFLPEVVRLNDEAMKEMLEETKRSLQLTHPNIVRVFDFHQDSEAAAIAMELVEGKSLSSAKTSRTGTYFEVEDIESWVKQICHALRYAHEKARVVHRDIKPQNVLLDAKGEAKVCDFGISRSVADTMTRLSTEVSFTPAYGSPEQAMGAAPNERQDVYSLGALIYDLLTGRPPFFRGDVLAQLREVVPPSMTERRQEFGIQGTPIPKHWEETVADCLQKNPDQRPQTIAEVEERLFNGGKRAAPKSSATKPAKKGGIPMVVPLVLIAALVTCGWFAWKHLGPGQLEPESSGQAQVTTEPSEATASNGGSQTTSAAPGIKAGENFVVEDLKLEMLWIPPLNSWVSKTEITQEQYALGGGVGTARFPGSQRAQDSVTWNQAMAYCENLTKRQKQKGMILEGYVYTLPTEKQWEVFVADATLDQAVYGVDESAGPSEPGTKPPNLFGLVDVRGNLWEWMLNDHTPGDPTKGKALRGGSYVTSQDMVMDSGARYYGKEDNEFWQYGFRVILTPEDGS